MTGMPLVVNGETVEDVVLSREAEAMRQRFEQLTEEQRQQPQFRPGELEKTAVEWARENVIEQVLLRQAALADARPLDPEAVETSFREIVERHGGDQKFAESGIDPDRVRADIEARLKVDRLIGEVTSRAKSPKQKELADFYRRNRSRFRTEEMVRAAHIVKHVEKGVTQQQARDGAESLYAKLQHGSSFEEIADSQSDCPGNGGDLGYFGRGKMVTEFENVVFGLDVGETSGVFQTAFGFHIAKVLDRKPAGFRPFAAVKGELEKEIMDARRTKLLEDYVDRLRESASIEVPQPGDASNA